jgi:hypothetical protein
MPPNPEQKMRDSEEIDWDAVDWDAVDYVHACGVTLVHRREQLLLDGALPPCEVAPADRATLREVMLAPIAGRLWLPEPEAGSAMDGPDGSWQGWEWPDGSWLLLMAYRDPQLPMLASLAPGGSSSRRAVVAGQQMHVRRCVPGDGVYVGDGYAADVQGILGEQTRFWAQVVAPTVERRDALLAALLTMEVSGGEALWGPRADGSFGPSDDGG